VQNALGENQMPAPTTAEVLRQYESELAKMEAAGQQDSQRYSDYQQRINEIKLEQYQENKAQEAKDKASARPFKCGGKVKKMSCGGKTHKMKSGGKVKGSGCAQRGVRKCKMY
jgi:hypothetical protein